MSSRQTPRYIEIDGRKYAGCFLPDLMRSALNYKPKADDIFVATYPKCGTTWVIQIVLAILRKGELPSDSRDYFASCPFLEMLGKEEIENMPRPGCIKIHLPYDLTPQSPDAKYIYVARNPKDCCISFFHHTRFFPGYYFSNGTFDDFFECFIKGEVDFGDYFDNLLSWYEHRNDSNVLFLTFEEMKKDHRGTVVRIAKFIGKDSALDVDKTLLENIVRLSSFEYMKDNNNKAWNDMIGMSDEIINDPNVPKGFRSWGKCNSDAIRSGEGSVGEFFRSGKSGQAKYVFTPEQEEKLRRRIEEKTKGSDVMNLWDE